MNIDAKVLQNVEINIVINHLLCITLPDYHCTTDADLERERAPDGDDDGPPLKVDGDEERSLSHIHVVPSIRYQK